MEARQRGFSLIQMATTIAIAGILAAIAFPTYSAYVIRSRIADSLIQTGPCRLSIGELFQSPSSGGFQPDSWGCNEGTLRPSEFVHVIHTDANGAITITLSPTDGRLGAAMGQDIVLTPAGGNLNGALPATTLNGWVCTPGAGMPPELLPSSCRS